MNLRLMSAMARNAFAYRRPIRGAVNGTWAATSFGTEPPSGGSILRPHMPLRLVDEAPQILVLVAFLLLTACSAQLPRPELDPLKVQAAISQLGGHVIAIEKKLGIVYPEPTPGAK